MWRIMKYNLLFSAFSAYFDYSIQKQPQTEEPFILYTHCNMENAFSSFLTKNSLILLIFNINGSQLAKMKKSIPDMSLA